MYTCEYTHTCMHACMHTYIHTYIHTNVFMYICIFMSYPVEDVEKKLLQLMSRRETESGRSWNLPGLGGPNGSYESLIKVFGLGGSFEPYDLDPRSSNTLGAGLRNHGRALRKTCLMHPCTVQLPHCLPELPKPSLQGIQAPTQYIRRLPYTMVHARVTNVNLMNLQRYLEQRLKNEKKQVAEACKQARHVRFLICGTSLTCPHLRHAPLAESQGP